MVQVKTKKEHKKTGPGKMDKLLQLLKYRADVKDMRWREYFHSFQRNNRVIMLHFFLVWRNVRNPGMRQGISSYMLIRSQNLLQLQL